MKKINYFMKKQTNKLKNEESKEWVHQHNVHYAIIRELFKPCPFCGNQVNVFTVPEDRYGEMNPFSWNIECMNMGCIFQRPKTGDQSFTHLMESWNKRS